MINVNWLMCIIKDGGQTTDIERTKVSLQRQVCINFRSRSSSHLLNNISTGPSQMGLTSSVAVQSALLRRLNLASGIIAGATRSKTSSEEQVNLRKEMEKDRVFAVADLPLRYSPSLVEYTSISSVALAFLYMLVKRQGAFQVNTKVQREQQIQA